MTAATPARLSSRRELLCDEELVALARDGDGEAFGSLVRRHQDRARLVAMSLVSDWAEAEDLAQDAFVRAHQNLDLLSDPARFGAWLARIVFGVCIDWLRTFRPQLYRGADERDGAGAAAYMSVPTADAGAHDIVERVELADRVASALARLPERYRLPLTLYHLDGLTHAKVASVLGVPSGTVRSLVARARDRLSVHLESYAKEVLSMPERGGSLAELFTEQPAAKLLHILNGDSTREIMERSSVPGEHAVWADALHDGPVPPFDVGEDEWRRIRTRFAEEAGWVPRGEALRMLGGWDHAVARYGEFDEAVIWCEHDLFDQLLLIRHLAWFAERDLGRTKLSLICIGEYPGMPAFKGLGELNADQLASLLGTRQSVSWRQLEIGRRAWRAFTSDDPTAIEKLLSDDTSALPFLRGALERLLEEYPALGDGLSRTDRQALSLIEGGATDLSQLFRANHALENRFYIGDTSFIARLRMLAAHPVPLIELAEGAAPKWWEGGRAELTQSGRDVLAGRTDAVRLRGIDTWIGGVHLEGAEPAWRWDTNARRLRRSSETVD